MAIEKGVARRINASQGGRHQRVAGISPGKSDIVLKDDAAEVEPSWFFQHFQWAGLGATAKGPARPVEHKSESGRLLALHRVGAALILLAFALAAAGQVLLAALLFLFAVAAVAFHYKYANLRLAARRPPMPVFTGLPAQGLVGHSLKEDIELSLQGVMRNNQIVLEEQVNAATGSLKLFLRQGDPALDAARQKIYKSRFGSVRAGDISLGYVAFNRPPAVNWELPDSDKAKMGLAVASPRVLQAKSPFPPKERVKLFAIDGRDTTHCFEAHYQFKSPLSVCPSITASAMIDPISAGNTLRFTIARAINDRCPVTRVRVSRISGHVRLDIGGPFGRPSVELCRKSGDGDGIEAVSFEDDPQIHAPKFSLKFDESGEFRPGDRLTIHLVFQAPIQPQREDGIWFDVALDFISPVAGFEKLAVFDPLGYPVIDRDGRQTQATFKPLSKKSSTLQVTGALSLANLIVTQEETFKDSRIQPGRSPNAELVHELISMLVTDFGLAMRDVREDITESMVWTILGKASENMLSPDVAIRVAAANASDGGEATSVEVSVIARFPSPEACKAAKRLKAAISESIQQLLIIFSERPSEEVQPQIATGLPVNENRHDLSDRLENVVVRAEALLARLESAFGR
ncbi:MAG: hypothetical protein K0U74_15595 [Alphaproteobacteria bacterium]|nr:hypothetical protein [Alphaproteobacteria bacterium]